MAELARAPEDASHKRMAKSTLEAEFWAVVEECLVRFHQFPKSEAKKKIRDLWRRLADIQLKELPTEIPHQRQTSHSFNDMIYHEEPWYIACNLADHDLPIDQNWAAYNEILRSHLA